MIIQCDSCQATYDFPAERIPRGGLKAKCAECGKVLNVRPVSQPPVGKPPGRALGPASLEPKSITAPPPKVQAPIDAPPPRRPASNQPSVIVDMGQLNDPVETAAAEQAAATQAAFAPLAGGAVEAGAADRHRVRSMPAFDGPDPSEIQEIKPPSMAKWAVLAVVLVLGGFAAWVGAANGWEPIWYEDPVTATKRALGFEKPPAPPPEPEPVHEVAPITGALEVEDVEMTTLKLGKRRLIAILRGRVVNHSNRLQHSIVFDADLMDAEREGELSLATRRADCCAMMDDAEAKAAARQADHPHFSEKSGGENVRLAPGESRAFTIVLRDLDPALDKKPIAPRVQVRFAEVEHPQ